MADTETKVEDEMITAEEEGNDEVHGLCVYSYRSY